MKRTLVITLLLALSCLALSRCKEEPAAVVAPPKTVEPETVSYKYLSAPNGFAKIDFNLKGDGAFLLDIEFSDDTSPKGVSRAAFKGKWAKEDDNVLLTFNERDALAKNTLFVNAKGVKIVDERRVSVRKGLKSLYIAGVLCELEER